MNFNRTLKVSKYLIKLWGEGKLSQDFKIGDVIAWAKSEGMRFNRRSILSAIRSSPYLISTKKVSGVPYFAQKYPSSHKDEDHSRPLNIQLFEQLDIHPEIKKVASKLYLNGHYDLAVFSSFKKINNLVKKKSEQQNSEVQQYKTIDRVVARWTIKTSS